MVKSSIVVELDSRTRAKLEARAKKELLAIEELVGDILRRSVLSYHKTGSFIDNVDDKLISIFSRKKR